VTGYIATDQTGNLLWWGDLATPKSCPSGAAVTFAAGAIDAALPQGT
jgi:hypothetical protein